MTEMPTRTASGIRAVLPLIAAAALVAGCTSRGYREVKVDDDGPSVPSPLTTPTPRATTLRFSVAAMQSPQDTYAAYFRLVERVARRMGLQVEFIQRRTYREVNDLLASGGLDAAFVCTGGYLDLERRARGDLEVVAVPVVDGSTTYQSLVIVGRSSPARSLADLKGKRFAYTDELSFSGHTYPVYLLRQAGEDPERYFESASYTHSHDRSIAGVADGVVDGAAVDSLVFKYLSQRNPGLTSRVRVIHSSPPFGLMPVVASTRLDPARRAAMRQVLLSLHDDPEAAEALRTLHMERFILPPPALYDSAAQVVESGR